MAASLSLRGEHAECKSRMTHCASSFGADFRSTFQLIENRWNLDHRVRCFVGRCVSRRSRTSVASPVVFTTPDRPRAEERTRIAVINLNNHSANIKRSTCEAVLVKVKIKTQCILRYLHYRRRRTFSLTSESSTEEGRTCKAGTTSAHLPRPSRGKLLSEKRFCYCLAWTRAFFWANICISRRNRRCAFCCSIVHTQLLVHVVSSTIVSARLSTRQTGTKKKHTVRAGLESHEKKSNKLVHCCSFV